MKRTAKRTFGLLAAALLALAAASPPQRTFETPEQAVEAWLQALAANDDAAMLDLLGHEYQEHIVQTDKLAQREERERLHGAATEALVLRRDTDDRIVLVIGRKAWPSPVPLVREDGRWRFDTAAGVEEAANRRIGSHELAAIELCRAYVTAQVEYSSTDRDGDRVLEYAKRFQSTTGQQDGLYWPSEEDPSPFGPFVAAAGDYAKGRQVGDPFKGYYFRILTRQGAAAPGGAYDYVINGNMIAGFALVAFPADYGSSGVMSFLVSHQGTVFQKDLGERTAALAGAMAAYDPGAGWAELAE
jgi:hypothetical protein